MSHQSWLLAAMREAFIVEGTPPGPFTLREIDGSRRSVSLTAQEEHVRACVLALASDGLAALGAIAGDDSGESAGMGLLAVHIEELVASDSDVTGIVVSATGLRHQTQATHE